MAEIYNLLPSQIPEHIRREYPVYCLFIEYYYKWLASRSLGKLENLIDIDFTSKAIAIFGNTLPIEDYIGHIIYGELSKAKAIILGYADGRLIVKYITKDAIFEVGENFHIISNQDNTSKKDDGVIDGIYTLPSVFIDHFSQLLDTNNLFGKDNESIALILKNIKDLYLSKGTEDALKYLLKAGKGVDSDVIYPMDYVLKPSDGRWVEQTAVTFRTIFGELPTEALDEIRFMSYGEYEYKDFAVVKTEWLADTSLLRLYFNTPPTVYEKQIVEQIVDDKVVWAGEVIIGQAKIKVVEGKGGKGWQVGQVFRIGGSNPWWVESFSYDEPLKPWWRRNWENRDNDYGEEGTYTHVIQEKKPTIIRISVVGDEGEVRYAEIIQLGEHFEDNLTHHQFSQNPLFFQTGEQWEREYDATFEFEFDTSATMVGFWNSNKGMLSDNEIRLQDSYYYQQFSYDISSTVNPDDYEHLAYKLHPAGTKLFTTYILGTELSLKEKMGVSVSMPSVNVSIFDIANVVDTMAKLVSKAFNDTTTNRDFVRFETIKKCFDEAITSETIAFKPKKLLADFILTTDTIGLNQTKVYLDTVNTESESILHIGKTLDDTTSNTDTLVLKTTSGIEDFSLTSDLLGRWVAENLAYDFDYYERLLDDKGQNISYGGIGWFYGFMFRYDKDLKDKVKATDELEIIWKNQNGDLFRMINENMQTTESITIKLMDENGDLKDKTTITG